MAHSKQAQKRVRQTNARNEQNRSQRSEMRTQVKSAESVIATADKAATPTAFKAAMQALHRAAGKGLIHKNTAARKISRLAARIKSQQASTK